MFRERGMIDEHPISSLQTITYVPSTTSSGVKRATMTKAHPFHDTANDAQTFHGLNHG